MKWIEGCTADVDETFAELTMRMKMRTNIG